MTFLLLLGFQMVDAFAQLDELQGLNDRPKFLSPSPASPTKIRWAQSRSSSIRTIRNTPRAITSSITVHGAFSSPAKLEKDPAATEHKSHIYLFDRSEGWEEFQKAGRLEPRIHKLTATRTTCGGKGKKEFGKERNPVGRWG